MNFDSSLNEDMETWTAVRFEAGDQVDLGVPTGRITIPRTGIYLVGHGNATYLGEFPFPPGSPQQEEGTQGGAKGN